MGYCVDLSQTGRVGAGTANRGVMAIRAENALVEAWKCSWIHHRAVDIFASWAGLSNSTHTEGQN